MHPAAVDLSRLVCRVRQRRGVLQQALRSGHQEVRRLVHTRRTNVRRQVQRGLLGRRVR